MGLEEPFLQLRESSLSSSSTGGGGRDRTSSSGPLFSSHGEAATGKCNGSSPPAAAAAIYPVMMAVILAGAVNTVLRRITLVPLANYPVFFSIFTALSYTLMYGAILTVTVRRGIVTREMLNTLRGSLRCSGCWTHSVTCWGTLARGVSPVN